MAMLRMGRMTTDPHGRPMINTEEGLFDISEAKYENFEKFSGGLISFPCLYESRAWEQRLGDYPFYTGRLYLLPVNAETLPEIDVVELGHWLLKLKVFILVQSASSLGHIWNSYFLGRKFQYYMPAHDMPLAIIRGLLVKACSGSGTFMDSICAAEYDKIPLNFHDDKNTFYAQIKGSEMSAYKLPWNTPNSSVIANSGRPLDWSKSCRDNNIADGEIVYCRLLRPGNGLSAYPGSEAPNYKLLGLEFLLGSLF